MGAVVIFGDVHGDLKKLQRLVAFSRKKYGEDLQLYSVGDLVDRGPNSRGVLDFCVKEGVQGICGNHELWMVDVFRGGPVDNAVCSKIMGGTATLASYGVELSTPEKMGQELRKLAPKEHQEYILQLPAFRFVEAQGVRHLLVHTGIATDYFEEVASRIPKNRKQPNQEQMIEILHRIHPDRFFWTGAKPRQSPHRTADFEGVVQVFGHTPVSDVVVQPHFVALDTGCGTCAPFALSALVIPETGAPEIVTIRPE